jgi:hypothetical protein
MQTARKGPEAAVTPQAHDSSTRSPTLDASSDKPDKPTAQEQAPQDGTLKLQFDAALDLLQERLRLGAEWTEWRKKVRADGLDANVLLKLARENLPTAEERRKAFETAEIERLYRQGLDLPLLAWGKEGAQ